MPTGIMEERELRLMILSPNSKKTQPVISSPEQSEGSRNLHAIRCL